MQTLATPRIAGTKTTKSPPQRRQPISRPERVLEKLLVGNSRFVNGTPLDRNLAALRAATAAGQKPRAAILSCLDSRVPVETIFDQGIGDVFVGRVAGNVVEESQLGSLEFATEVVGVRVVIVLGHSDCGAIKGACDGTQLGHLTALLDRIKPAVDSVKGYPPEQRTSANPEFVSRVIENNVRHGVSELRRQSAVIRGLENGGAIIIRGAVYDLSSGIVTLLEP